jgi:peptidoglycan hydrolase-like protein with peptidoglycan-binding domain
MSTLFDIPSHSMPYDDPFDTDEVFEDLMRPDEDEEALLALAARRSKARRKKRTESGAIRKTVTGMLDSEGSALLFGTEDDPEGSANNGPLVAEMEREQLQAIFNPLHNARQIAKELTLLEDHLIQPPQHCPDCIRKHLLRAEAYADEAMGLDEEGSFVDTFGDVQQALRGVSRDYLQVSTDRRGRQALAQRVRKVRKVMSKMGFSSVLDSKMQGDAPAQPRVSEPVGSANTFGVKRGRSRKRALAFRGTAPSGSAVSQTVGGGEVVLSNAYSNPRKDTYDLQRQLIYWEIPVADDGIYGEGTEAAVKAVQRAASLPQTGTFDQNLYQLVFLYNPNALGAGSPLTSAKDALSLAAEIVKFEKAQDVLVETGMLSASQRGQERGDLGPYTQGAVKNFLSSIGDTPKFASKTLEGASVLDGATSDKILNQVNIDKVKASPLRIESVAEVSPQAARGLLVGAGLLWPGEESGGEDDNLRAAVRDYQRIHGLTQSGGLDAATSAALLDGQKLSLVASMVRGNPNGVGDGSGKLVPWSKLARSAPSVQPGTTTASLSMTVTEAQQRLNRASASPRLVEDNRFGSATKAALVSFQRTAGLSVTGSLDQATIRALRDDSVIAKVKAKRESAAAAAAPASTPTARTPAPAGAPVATTPASPAAPPALPKGPALPPDYAPDPTGSNATTFRAKFPQFGPEIDALMVRERQIRSLARYGALDDLQINALAKDWWSLSRRTGDPWPAMHGAWLAGKAGNARLASQILNDASRRFVGTPAGEAASSALASLPEGEDALETLREAAPYLAAGAGVLLVAGLLFRGDR